MTSLELIALIVFLLVNLLVLQQIDWRAFVQHSQQQHLLFGSMAAILLLWIFRAGIYDGLDVHFLWVTALTLTLGFRYAILVTSLASLVMVALGKEDWWMLGANGMLTGIIPVAISYLIFSYTFHRIPRNLFMYIFVNAFFPGALTIALQIFTTGSFYYFNNVYSWDVVFNNYVLLIPLMVFPEALLNGMTMTLLVVYRHHWVKTFADHHYFDHKS